jgi:hypothetical protein
MLKIKNKFRAKSNRVYKNDLNRFLAYPGHEKSCNSMTVEAYLNGVGQVHDMTENEIDNLLIFVRFYSVFRGFSTFCTFWPAMGGDFFEF